MNDISNDSPIIGGLCIFGFGLIGLMVVELWLIENCVMFQF